LFAPISGRAISSAPGRGARRSADLVGKCDVDADETEPNTGGLHASESLPTGRKPDHRDEQWSRAICA
jgi:hypothetical protein